MERLIGLILAIALAPAGVYAGAVERPPDPSASAPVVAPADQPAAADAPRTCESKAALKCCKKAKAGKRCHEGKGKAMRECTCPDKKSFGPRTPAGGKKSGAEDPDSDE